MCLVVVPESMEAPNITVEANSMFVTWLAADICDVNGNFEAYYLRYSYTDPLNENAIVEGKSLNCSATFDGKSLDCSATFDGESLDCSATFDCGSLDGSATFDGKSLDGSATFELALYMPVSCFCTVIITFYRLKTTFIFYRNNYIGK